MKKLLLIFLLFPINSFAVSGECHRQSNPMGYENYDVCEVAGTGYSCVSLSGKANGGISCFPTSDSSVQDESQEANYVKQKGKFNNERRVGN